MKQKITLIILLLSLIGYAQNGINYKAVVKDDLGNIVANESVDIRFTILQGSTNAYQETHDITTDSNGIVIVNIGEGTVVSGTFSAIVWGNGVFSLKTEIDLEQNGSYDIEDTTAFKTVPYALNVAKKQRTIGIPASSFSPNNNDCTFFNSIGNGGVEITSTSGAVVTSVLNAPLQLPHGAQIESMTVYYIDNSESQLRIWLVKENYDNGFAIISEVMTNGNSSTPAEETNAVNHIVNNENGGYFLRVFCDDWNASGTKRTKGVKISYTY